MRKIGNCEDGSVSVDLFWPNLKQADLAFSTTEKRPGGAKRNLKGKNEKRKTEQEKDLGKIVLPGAGSALGDEEKKGGAESGERRPLVGGLLSPLRVVPSPGSPANG